MKRVARSRVLDHLPDNRLGDAVAHWACRWLGWHSTFCRGRYDCRQDRW